MNSNDGDKGPLRRGRVIRYNREREVGFLSCDSLPVDVFFHFRQVSFVKRHPDHVHFWSDPGARSRIPEEGDMILFWAQENGSPERLRAGRWAFLSVAIEQVGLDEIKKYEVRGT